MDSGLSVMERLGRLFDVTHELLAVVGFDNRYKFMNAAWESALGFPREELLASSPGTYVHPEDSAATQADIQKVMSGIPSTAFENRMRCKNGSYRWFSWYSMSSPAEECFYVAGRDITERKRAEEELAKREAFFNSLIRNTPVGIVAIDAERNVQMCNPAFEAIFNYREQEIVGRRLCELVTTPELREEMTAVEQKLLRGETAHIVTRRKRCDESLVDVEVHSVPLHSDGKYTGAVVLYQDVSQRKRAEEQALRLARALENNSEMISMTDSEGRMVFGNRALLQATGYRKEELLGKSVEETLFSPNNPPAVREELQTSLAREGRWRGECLQRRPDGVDAPISLSISVLRDDEGRMSGVFSIAQDISERRRLEDRLLQLGHALQNSGEMICLSDHTGNAVFVNQALLRASGYAEEEILGKQFNETIFSRNNPRTLADEIRNGIVREGKWSGEALQRRKNGPDMPVLLSISVLQDGEGRVTGAFAVAQDVTEQRRLEEQLRGAQKMEAVGQLAGGVAHDFNNLLMVIMGYAGDLKERLHASDPLHKKVEEIERAGERAASLTRQLLAFSRQQVLEPRVLDLNSVVEDLQGMLRRLIREDIELVTELDAELGQVKADQGQIEQVIVNLIVNARDAMPRGGRLTIQTSNVQVDEAVARLRPTMSPGTYVRLTVTDTGTGMDAATQSHIFEPFFTTKERGKGTGLGLATVYGVVKQSGGFIWVSSELGHGATFEIFLPRVGQPAPATAPDDRTKETATGSETILLVEDDEALRTLILEALGARGYTVLEAAGGVEALRLVRQQSCKIDLLLTDVVMPGMRGPQVAESVVALCPNVKVLYMSGYADFGAGPDGFLKPGERLLQKPYTLTELARTVREVLEGSLTPALASR